jgi:hypothetical protein
LPSPLRLQRRLQTFHAASSNLKSNLQVLHWVFLCYPNYKLWVVLYAALGCAGLGDNICCSVRITCPSDLLHYGIATHYIPQTQLQVWVQHHCRHSFLKHLHGLMLCAACTATCFMQSACASALLSAAAGFQLSTAVCQTAQAPCSSCCSSTARRALMRLDHCSDCRWLRSHICSSWWAAGTWHAAG